MGQESGQSRAARGNTSVYAAIDLGTNNCRMLVARPRNGGFRVVDSFSRIVRLGEGLSSNNDLSEAAIERTVKALQVCADKMDANGVGRARCVATEACRRAGNGAFFLDRVREETGLDLEAISADEEAHLTLLGCSSLLDKEKSYTLLFDIGGGSTEISWVERQTFAPHRRRAFLSLPYGVVTLAEKHGFDRIPARRYEEIVTAVEQDLRRFDADADILEQAATGNMQMIGTSGTVTTLGGLYLDLPRYERARVDGLDMRIESIRAISAKLASQCCTERAAHPCIGHGRADLVVAGCAILEAICRRWPVRELRVADRGIREGLLLAMMEGCETPPRAASA